MTPPVEMCCMTPPVGRAAENSIPGTGAAEVQCGGSQTASSGYQVCQIRRCVLTGCCCHSIMYNVYRGRLKHGRHFTFKSFAGDVAITFVCAGVQGAFADERHLYAAHGPWLQVFLRPEFFDLFLADVESFLNAKKVCSHCHC